MGSGILCPQSGAYSPPFLILWAGKEKELLLSLAGPVTADGLQGFVANSTLEFLPSIDILFYHGACHLVNTTLISN